MQGNDAQAEPAQRSTWGRSLKRAWGSWGGNLDKAVDKEDIVRPRAGGKLGKSFRSSLSKLYGGSVDNSGLVYKELIGEGTCGLVHRGVYNGCQVAVKILKQTEQYESEGTCPLDARESLARYLFDPSFKQLHRCTARYC